MIRINASVRFAAAALFCAGQVTLAAVAGAAEPASFEEISIIMEQNATDGDVEVVIEANPGDDGLKTLSIVGPKERTIVQFKTPDSKLGLRKFLFESPELDREAGAVQRDFPAGEYLFSATTVSGKSLQGRTSLSHELPATATLLNPLPDAEDVPLAGLTIRWKRANDLESCIVVIEQEDSGFEITAKLPGSATKFAVPDGTLLPETAYKIAIGTVAEDGNTSFIEAEVTTAGR